MCGITGLIQFNNRDSDMAQDIEHILKPMTDALTHRGPDSSGYWVDENLPVGLGHRRLAIVDLSAQGHQPMHSTSGRYVLAYNGEIYNFLSLKTSLEDLGHRFKGHSDTEVFLAAIEEWGLNAALQKINGMFAIALWDKQSEELHLIRDRFGKKPLYVGWVEDSLIFGSELKALHQYPDFKKHKVIDKDVLALYMRYSYVPAPYSIFKNIWTVPAGCRLCLNYANIDAGQDLSKLFEVYFDCGRVLQDAKTESFTKDFDAQLDGLEQEVQAAVERRLISDVPLGAFLSGGIDSSLVVAMMQKLSSTPVKTFSIGFHEKDYNEAEFAKAVAEHLGAEHTEYYIDADTVREALHQMAEIYDEPFADASQMPTFLIAQRAKKDVTVVLTGDGGDEMFAGYKRHFEAPAVWRKLSLCPRFLRCSLKNVLFLMLPTKLKNNNFRVNRLLEVMDAESLSDFYDRLAGQWHNSTDLVNGAKALERRHAAFDVYHRGLKAEEQMVFADVVSHLPDRMNVKVDRASMANSLETRAPLMDVDLFQHAWRLPLSSKVSGNKGKFILRSLLERYVPKTLFERPKQGFTPPLNAWLCSDFKSWVEPMVHDSSLPANQYFNLDLIRQSWERVLKGSEADTLRVWNFVMFHLWYERWGKA